MTGDIPIEVCGALCSPKPSDTASFLEIQRRNFKPLLPRVLTTGNVFLEHASEDSLINAQDLENNAPHILDATQEAVLKSLFPYTFDTPFYTIANATSCVSATSPIRVGVVLSGGQASGGHNVICGVYEYVKKVNANSAVFGFLGGPHGVYSGEYIELTDAIIAEYSNMGGFDMIRSGRHKIETDLQKQNSLEVCKKLKLNGLIVIGGDDSNTNAAILAEYFRAHDSSTCVIGCPKTIDGDLKNVFVEISFGFDSACTTYSHAIGNLMMEAICDGSVYQFVRLMGRSASLITLECALRTHPNMCFIGEEVLEKQLSLKQLVDQTADLVEMRQKAGKAYGVILLPEGLIEFIPEIGVLISEINSIVAAGAFDVTKLTASSRAVFLSLPPSTHQQLLLDRDPHGNVQVALIHTEKLLLDMTTKELERRKFSGAFRGRCFYFGYEGRSGFPSDFDASYCYALGNVAGVLVQNKATSCMAVLKNMSAGGSVENWKPAGIPLTKMMVLETRKGKANIPVIKKFLVDINKPLFKTFEKVRGAWMSGDFYRVPGPMELNEDKPQLPFTLTGPPSLETLLPASAATIFARGGESRQQYCKAFSSLCSNLQKRRLVASVDVPKAVAEKQSILELAPGSGPLINADLQGQISKLFPHLSKDTARQSTVKAVVVTGAPKVVRVGVTLLGEAVPGVSNVLYGLFDKVVGAGGTVFGFQGSRGLMRGEFLCLNDCPSLVHCQKNMGSFPLLGRTASENAQLLTQAGLKSLAHTVITLKLDVLVLLCSGFLECSIISESLRAQGVTTSVVCVCGSPALGSSDELACAHALASLSQHTLVVRKCSGTALLDADAQTATCESTGVGKLGLDTQTKVAGELVGNLLTDSNSAAKYFYFCRVGGGFGAEAEIGIQSHANICLLTSEYISLTPTQVATSIADDVAARCAAKKNFGLLIVNEDFFLSNKSLCTLAFELSACEGKSAGLSPTSQSILQSLGPNFSSLMCSTFNRTKDLMHLMKEFPVHELLANMVSVIIKERLEAKKMSGSFAPLCFDLVDPVRGALPSPFDCNLGITLGMYTGLLVTSPLVSQTCASALLLSKNTSTPDVNIWQPLVVPVCAAVACCGVEALPVTGKFTVSSASMAALAEKILGKECQSKRYAKMCEEVTGARAMWLMKDTYINSGPLQFPETPNAAAEDFALTAAFSKV